MLLQMEKHSKDYQDLFYCCCNRRIIITIVVVIAIVVIIVIGGGAVVGRIHGEVQNGRLIVDCVFVAVIFY